MQKLLFIGLVGYSYFYKLKEDSKLGDTTVADEFHTEIGGKAFNQAYMATLLKADATLLTTIAKDNFSKIIKNDLKKCHVKTKFIKKAGNNLVASIITSPKGNNVYLSGAVPFNIDDLSIIKKAIDNADIIAITNEIKTSVVKEIIEYCHQMNKYIVFNYSPATNSFDLTKINLIIVNENERDDLNLTNEKIISEDLHVIITKGENGASYISKDEIIDVLGIKEAVSDTTGAGDIFLGTLLTNLAKDLIMKEALYLANKYASQSVKYQYVLPSIENVARNN